MTWGKTMIPRNLKAHCQYDDWTGSVAFDLRHPILTLSKHIIDEEKFFLIGIEVCANEMIGQEAAWQKVYAIAVDRSSVGGNYDAIMEYVETHKGEPLPVVKFDLEVSFEEFLGITKRFSIVASFKPDLLGVEVLEQEKYD